jgi:hypothetical protein
MLIERSNLPVSEPRNVLKHHIDAIQLRRGSGRLPQVKRFCIRIKRYAVCTSQRDTRAFSVFK